MFNRLFEFFVIKIQNVLIFFIFFIIRLVNYFIFKFKNIKFDEEKATTLFMFLLTILVFIDLLP